MKTINILGEKYTVEFRNRDEDPKLDGCDGYTDTSINLIVVDDMSESGRGCKADLPRYQGQVLRHEIIHAFLHESGLDVSSWAHEEEIVDWIAIQLPKIAEVVEEAFVQTEEPKAHAVIPIDVLRKLGDPMPLPTEKPAAYNYVQAEARIAELEKENIALREANRTFANRLVSNED